MSVGQVIRAAITARKLVHRDVAAFVGLTDVELSHVLAGRRLLKACTAVYLERLLDVDGKALLVAQAVARELATAPAIKAYDAERVKLESAWGAVAPLALADANGMAV